MSDCYDFNFVDNNGTIIHYDGSPSKEISNYAFYYYTSEPDWNVSPSNIRIIIDSSTTLGDISGLL